MPFHIIMIKIDLNKYKFCAIINCSDKAQIMFNIHCAFL